VLSVIHGPEHLEAFGPEGATPNVFEGDFFLLGRKQRPDQEQQQAEPGSSPHKLVKKGYKTLKFMNILPENASYHPISSRPLAG
jgi:hypothetical protein